MAEKLAHALNLNIGALAMRRMLNSGRMLVVELVALENIKSTFGKSPPKTWCDMGLEKKVLEERTKAINIKQINCQTVKAKASYTYNCIVRLVYFMKNLSNANFVK